MDPRKPVAPIPEGYRTVTPYLVVKDAAKLIDFITNAFAGRELHRLAGPDGKVMHAEVQIGDSRIMLGEASEAIAPTTTMIHLYVEDCDATYRTAVAAGGESLREPADQFYGDRSSAVKDAFGNQWYVATHIEDVSQEEVDRRAKAACGG